MKRIFIFITIISLVACSTGDKNEIKTKLAENKKAIKELKKENSKLEKQLAKMDGKESKFQVPVEIQKIEGQTFAHYIEANGMIEAVENAVISPEVPGQIKQIHVKEGNRVNKGDLLVTLNANVILNSIEEVKKGLELAKEVYEKQKSLWDQKIGSEIQYLQAKNNKESLEQKLKTLNAQLAMYYIKAPFSGLVDQVVSKEGELANPGFPVLQLVNLYNLKINADVSEAYLPAVKKGDMVEVGFPTYPDVKRNYPIFRTGNIIHQDNRTFNVQVRLKNEGEKFKPNMMAVLKIKDFEQDNAFVVPSIVIKNDITGKFLFITAKEEGNDIAKKVYVETGKSYLDQTVVLNGLKEGDQVIVKGFNTVSNGAEIKIQ